MVEKFDQERHIGAVFKIIFGGLLTLFGGGCVALRLFFAGPGGFSPPGPSLAFGVAALALGVAFLLLGWRQSRNDTRKD